ncbi:hypothetical protein DdX_03439 [Ditylenchus destructor]|uniref:Uncharacterized protein n=1 Tax=Ditylenchus destructor TaxID=166010 RepID=A0AAD4N8S4_9BILA|nr:hypothetical protein DdX_03439 [Ditylenchus destructor]
MSLATQLSASQFSDSSRQPSAFVNYSRQYSHRQLIKSDDLRFGHRQLPQLPSKSFSFPISDAEFDLDRQNRQTASYLPVRNKLAEQENRPMNQTYTIGMPTRRPFRNRASSIDSDFADYNIHKAISAICQKGSVGNSAKRTNHVSRKAHSQSSVPLPPAPKPSNGSCVFINKLPSLDGFSSDKKCCQKSLGSSRTQIDLAKFKDTLKRK